MKIDESLKTCAQVTSWTIAKAEKARYNFLRKEPGSFSPLLQQVYSPRTVKGAFSYASFSLAFYF